MNAQKDFYAILGVERDATAEEIRQAYFAAARRLHPDKNVAPGETQLFLEVQEAYETLSNPKRRAEYDATLPPPEPVEEVIRQRVLFSREHLFPTSEGQLVYVLLHLLAPPNAPRVSPPVNLCLVIDRSTSMNANMGTVKQTAIEILRTLKPQDFFSLVVFSDRAEVVIPAQNAHDVRRLETRIHAIQCSGGTEIFFGLQAGYQEVSRALARSNSNHIILLTDGRTYGDEQKCLELAREAAQQGITIRSLGIGTEWNDVFLDELSSITGGSSMYIARPDEIRHTLLAQIENIASIYAQDVRLDFKLPKSVELRYAFRLIPEPSLLNLSDSSHLGAINYENGLKILFEFVVHQTGKEQMVTLMDGKIRATLSGNVVRSVSVPLKLTRPVENKVDLATPPAEIVKALSKLILYRMQEQAQQEVAVGNFDKAAERLQRLATHLLAQNERALAKTALLEAEQLRKQRELSREGAKEIKYRTRALLLSSGGMDNGDLPKL
ncbi:MAG: VWA domain-containing protein [Anaerolineales bacterium]|nr:VWA domain-containing protein [Anaerolineales bacterium]MDW8227706.1 VWA domain-containing protein [Anaerolineales bacterium]